MTTSARASVHDAAAPAARIDSLASFRAWWSERRQEAVTMPAGAFVGQWWRALPLAMRRFIVAESGTHEVRRALAGDFEVLPPAEQERLLCCARMILRDLKPVSWL